MEIQDEKFLKNGKGEENEKEKQDKSGKNSKSSSIGTLSKIKEKSYQTSSRVLNVTKLSLLISVRFIKTLVLIASNIAILAYISSEVSHSNSLQALDNLSKIDFYTSEAGLVNRLLQLSQQTGIPTYSIDRAYQNMANLTELNNGLLSNYSSWSYCKASDIVTDNLIAYWEDYTNF